MCVVGATEIDGVDLTMHTSASRGTRRAPTKPISVQTAFRGTRRGRLCEPPKVIHTHEIDVTGLRRRSNNNRVDLDRVDNLADGQPEINIDRTGRVLDVSAPADFAVHLSRV
jgi:hypothetical protein